MVAVLVVLILVTVVMVTLFCHILSQDHKWSLLVLVIFVEALKIFIYTSEVMMASLRKDIYAIRNESDVILEPCEKGKRINMMMPQGLVASFLTYNYIINDM